MNIRTLASAASILALGAILASPGAAHAHAGEDHSSAAPQEVVTSDGGDNKTARKNKSNKATKSNKGKASQGKSRGNKK
jgi:hypothetical protein